MPNAKSRVIVIGAGVGGLTLASLLAQAGYDVLVLESQTYAGGSASTFTHKGYRFESGATVAGGFQPNGPHYVAGEKLGINWRVHKHDPAWVVHLPDVSIELTQDNADVLAKFPHTEAFWQEQSQIADMAWRMSAQGLPWPPRDVAELFQLAKVGLRNFPQDLRLIPFALSSVSQWMQRKGVGDDRAFRRFIDATLLISAQTTSQHVNALYGATAIDLPRQGVYHVEGGIGGIAEQLIEKLREFGGEILFRQHVTRISRDETGRVNGIYAKRGRRTKTEEFFPADWVVANTTPWSLDELLGGASPASLRAEVKRRPDTQGAFVLHIGARADTLPSNIPDHHQIVRSLDGMMGEGETLYISMSPEWDVTRAPQGMRAVTISTHTNVQKWWDLYAQGESAYYEEKEAYAQRMIGAVDEVIEGFNQSAELVLPGTPLTYQFYTLRHKGMVGGFPQTSLFKARSPRTGIANLRLVGDSIFPGQSTAGVTLGAMRVAEDIMRHLPLHQNTSAYSVPTATVPHTHQTPADAKTKEPTL
jgi:C-3',4' desaturase CrtD